MRGPTSRSAAAWLGVALTATVVAAAAAGAGLTARTAHGSGRPSSGGTLKIGWEQSFGFTDNFDPTGEFLGEAKGIFDNLLIRTLVGYKHTAGAAGNTIVPDLATAVPRPSDGGKTYTFHLKPGVRFSPPVNRAVTSKDVLYALERLAKPKNGAQYSFYYSVIKGFDAYGSGEAKTISGIRTPTPSTIVFDLTEATGDFLYRMTMPATGPIPVEVARCFEGQPGKYGQDLISTAGYMIQGIDQVDVSSCKSIRPASGYDGQTELLLVRNPNYSQATDPTRRNYVDEVRFLVDSSPDDIYNRIESGDLDLANSSIPPQVLRKYATSARLRRYLHRSSGDRTLYVTMNLTQPPFDDLHVRKAMNYVLDKTAMIQAWGGPTLGKVANHIVPDTVFDNQLAGFAPYRSPGDHGSVERAKAALKGSPYDTANDGQCSASACHGVLLLIDSRAVDAKQLSVLQADAKKIGITFEVRTTTGAYPTLQTPAKNVAISTRPVWGKDYADAVTFFAPLFGGRTIIANGNTNFSLVGITPAQCAKLGVSGDCTGVPSVDAQLARCSQLLLQARLSCYENLDKYLMTKVVPWVPYMWSNAARITSDNVTRYRFDQFSTTPAYSQIAVR